MSAYEFEALDTLFFRDGRPFNAGESGLLAVAGTFPPPPSSVVGALRAAAARALGWESGAWNPEIKARLGDQDDLGPLTFTGPFLRQAGHWLYPAPLALVGWQDEAGAWVRFTRFAPGPEVLTDLGMVRLPILPEADVVVVNEGAVRRVSLEGHWLSASGLAAFLSGGVPQPSDVVSGRDLWDTEARVGIARDPQKRTTGTDALYHTTHVRLRGGVTLGVGVERLELDSRPLPTPAPLGGESRAVHLRAVDGPDLPALPALEAKDGHLHYTVTLLTPAYSHPLFPTLPGKVLCACRSKSVAFGGWSMGRGPLPLQAHHPVGTTFFVRASASDLDAVSKLHLKYLDARAAWGYGLIAIGAWGNK